MGIIPCYISEPKINYFPWGYNAQQYTGCTLKYHAWQESKETKKAFKKVERKKQRSNQLLYADFCYDDLFKQFTALWKNWKKKGTSLSTNSDNFKGYCFQCSRLFNTLCGLLILSPRFFFSNLFLRTFQTHFLFFIIQYTNHKAVSKTTSVSQVSSKHTNFGLHINHEI